MPPRAAPRRVGRPRRGEEAPVEVSPATDDVHSPLPRLQKPHLPKLKGTPSSRRQYAYGAEEEPLPARAGSRMRNDEELDLGNAVGNLLERQEEEDTRERMPPPPPPIEPHEQEDELAAAPQPPAGRRTQGPRLGSKIPDSFVPNVYEALRRPQNGHLAAVTPQPDDMSLRSFGTESDIFGDAMISSPLPVAPPLAPIPEPEVQARPQVRPSNRRATREPSTSRVSAEPAQSLPQQQLLPQRRTGLGTTEVQVESQRQHLRQSPRRPPSRATREPEPRAIPRLSPPRNRLRLNTATKRPQLFASDYSEQDDEIQNSIRRDDEASEGQDSSARPPISPWRSGWITIKSYSPFGGRAHSDDDDEENDEEEDEAQEVAEDDSVVNATAPQPIPEPREWPLYLTLSFYTAAILRFMSFVNDHVTLMLIRIVDATQSAGQSISRINPWTALLVLFLALTGSWLALSAHDSSSPWSVSNTLGQIRIPSLPSFSLPFGGGGKHSSIIDMSPEDWENLPGELREMLDKIEREYNHLTTASRLQSDNIKAIKDSLPDMVYMEKKNGKLHVPERFWSAFRSRFTDDSTVLKHFVSGTLKDSGLTSKLTSGAKEVEGRLERKFNEQWNQWVADNKDKVNMGKPSGVFVTKDEFARHLEDFTNNRHDVRTALGQIKPTVQAFVREALEEAQRSQLTAREISALIQDVVKRELTGIQLDTHAKSEMNRNWHLLRKNINWFNPAAGATINAKKSSKTWRPVPKSRAHSWGLFGVDPPETMTALEPWFEEGDCWCATHDLDARKRPHGAKLVVQLGGLIVPQHIVLEHIHPDATMDPGARPKLIEVYGNYEHDTALRERVLGFANDRQFKPNTTTPDEAKDHDSSLLGWNFVMIGKFEYQEGTDGVHVHRLSEQLEAMGAETDEVAIRVVANDGDQDHTCFYRVRMFGQRKE